LLRLLATAIFVAFGALRQNALRGALTAFGILVGVAAVTTVVALGEGATRAVSGRIDSLGENALIVSPEETVRSGIRAGDRQGVLSEDDVRALAREANSVATAAPLLTGMTQVMFRDANVAVQLTGTSLEFFTIRAWRTERGELWQRSAETLGEKVCVLGSAVKADLFGSEDAVGKIVRIGRHPFRVTGVLATKGQGPFGQDQDNVVVMPVATMRSKLQPGFPGSVHRILLGAKSSGATESVEREVTAILRQRHELVEGSENDFRIRSQEEFRRTQEGILGVLSSLLLSVAAVSLLVGGIGVMNIMLVSVAERTREIGIRMAIGAREIDVLLQFLIEAVVLALLGGVAGAVVALGAIEGLERLLEWPMTLSPRALLIALSTSSVVGILFGFVPARRAARLDPIQALGRE